MAESTYQMPWGKHEGERMCDIPSGYLRWLTENIEPSGAEREDILDEAGMELAGRDIAGSHF